MGTTTFSGSVKAGTIREGAGTNTGFVVMAQSAEVTEVNAFGTTSIIIPANSQIIDVVLNVTTANDDTNAATVSVGTTDDGDAFIATANVKATGTTRGTLDTEATNIGTTDIQVLADFTGTDGDGANGAATVTVTYLQNNSIADAGDVPA